MKELKKDKDKGEIMRNAQRLIGARGEGALSYANKMAERMQKEGDEEEQAFWERIAAQIDLLIYEAPPDEN